MEKTKSSEKGPVLSLETAGVCLHRPNPNVSHHPPVHHSVHSPCGADLGTKMWLAEGDEGK